MAGEQARARLAEVRARVAEAEADERRRRIRAGKDRARTVAELAEWGADAHAPAPTLRRITRTTRQRPGRVTSWKHANGQGRLWWVGGVAYTADPAVIAACARKGYIIDDAPGGVPAEHAARVADAERAAAEREARAARRRAAASPDERRG